MAACAFVATLPACILTLVQRLKIHLLVALVACWLVPVAAVVIVDHAHLHIRQVQTGAVHLIVLKRGSCSGRCGFLGARLVVLLLSAARRRLTHLVALHLLLHLVLADEALVPSRVVVVWEELRQQQVHVWSALPAARSTSVPVPSLGVARGIGQLGEVLDVDVVRL